MDVRATKQRFRESCGTVEVTLGDGCSSNADCPAGEVCENGTCVDDGSGGGGGGGDTTAGLSLILVLALLAGGGYYVYTRR